MRRPSSADIIPATGCIVTGSIRKPGSIGLTFEYLSPRTTGANRTGLLSLRARGAAARRRGSWITAGTRRGNARPPRTNRPRSTRAVSMFDRSIASSSGRVTETLHVGIRAAARTIVGATRTAYVSVWLANLGWRGWWWGWWRLAAALGKNKTELVNTGLSAAATSTTTWRALSGKGVTAHFKVIPAHRDSASEKQ